MLNTELLYYSERDNRTNILVENLSDGSHINKIRNSCVLLIANEEISVTHNGQNMIVMCLNLISRFCNKIDLLIPSEINLLENISVLSNYSKLDTAILHTLKKIDPYGTFNLIENYEKDYDAIICIGPNNFNKLNKFVININSDGWISYVSCNGMVYDFISQNQNPIGAHVSACLAANEVFKKLLGANKGEYLSQVSFSALDYSINNHVDNPTIPCKIELGNVFLFGVGAIGCAFLNTFRCFGEIESDLTLVDYDLFDLTNLNRCLIASYEDVGKKKVDVAEDIFKGTRIKINKYFGNCLQFLEEIDGIKKLDIVLSLVDDNSTREKIQYSFPRFLLNGATDNMMFIISRHNFLDNACFACIDGNKTPKKDLYEIISENLGISKEKVKRLIISGERLPEYLFESISKSSGLSIDEIRKIAENNQGCSALNELMRNSFDRWREDEPSPTVSPVSALPGVLLAGEAIKDKYFSNYVLNNLFQCNLLKKLDYSVLLTLKKRPHCFCTENEAIDYFKQLYNL